MLAEEGKYIVCNACIFMFFILYLYATIVFSCDINGECGTRSFDFLYMDYNAANNMDDYRFFYGV